MSDDLSELVYLQAQERGLTMGCSAMQLRHNSMKAQLTRAFDKARQRKIQARAMAEKEHALMLDLYHTTNLNFSFDDFRHDWLEAHGWYNRDCGTMAEGASVASKTADASEGESSGEIPQNDLRGVPAIAPAMFGIPAAPSRPESETP